MKNIDVSKIFPIDYKSSRVGNLKELTPIRGGTNTYLTTIVHNKLTQGEVELLADFYLRTALQQHSVSLDDIIFTPADHIDHCNTEGKPVYVFEEILPTEDYKYEFETHFILK